MLKWKPEVPENISSLIPYLPGKPIEETRLEFGIDHVVKLASNENPLGASPKALDAIQKAHKELHLYPDGSHFKLKKALSEHHLVEPGTLVIGNGSNELIDLLIRVFVQKECNVVAQQKAFIAYKLCAQLQGCGFLEAPVDSDFRVNADSILKTINNKTKIVFLANPNNPTGTWMCGQELGELAAKLDEHGVLLVLDYAYWEYVTEKTIPDPVKIRKKHPNVVVLKTFSKIYGLAGLRVGYMIADLAVTSMIERSRQPFNVNSNALTAGTAALADDDFVKRSRHVNESGLHRLCVGLREFNVEVYPKNQHSQCNFILVDFKKSTSALYPELLRRGVILRPLVNYGLPTFFRISAGLEEENEYFLAVLKKVMM